jgi:putative nucleotidyltransferase with HDIG domain
MNRQEALDLLSENVADKNIQKHCFAVAAIMKSLAKKLGENEEAWYLAGLLHDLDYEKTKNDFSRHGLLAAEILKGRIDEKSISSIKAHSFENTKCLPKEKCDFALIASDALSGLLISTALIMPSKKLSEVTVESIAKKFKKKDFARAVSREKIMYCEKIGVSLEEFFAIGIEALDRISKEIGL